MNKQSNLTVLLLCCLTGLLYPAFSQNLLLSYQNPERLGLCDSAQLEFTISNPGPSTVSDLEILCRLPGNIHYITGSVQGANELNLTDPSMPQFSFAQLGVGENLVLRFWVKAGCQVLDYLNSGGLFSTTLEVRFDGGNTSLITDPFPVETPFLVISKIQSNFLKGSRGDILERAVTIRNTRLGRVSQLTFTDHHQGGMHITSGTGTDRSPDYYTFQLLLDGSHFSQIGNRDAFFDFNETITIVELLEITACGSDTTFSQSDLTVSWGCGGQYCQSASAPAFVQIDLNKKTPALEFEINLASPVTCFGAPDGSIRQSITIKNVGDDDAVNLVLNLDQDSLDYVAIEENSFSLDSQGFSRPVRSVTYLDGVNQSKCQYRMATWSKATVRLPHLQPGESLTLFWNNTFCHTECDQIRANQVTIDGSYGTICPPPVNKLIDFFQKANLKPPVVQASLGIDTVDAGGSLLRYRVCFQYAKEGLHNQTGTLQLDFQHHSAFQILNPDWSMGGVLPDLFQQDTIDQVPTYHLEYPLPFPGDSVGWCNWFSLDCSDIREYFVDCNKRFFTSCQDPCVPARDTLPRFGIDLIATETGPDNCPLDFRQKSCRQIFVLPNCILDCIDDIQLPGYLQTSYFTGRENLGLPDNNNDRRADNSGQLDLTKIRQDRLIPGDTLLVSMQSVVRTDLPGYEFDKEVRMVISMSPAGDMELLQRNRNFLLNGFRDISNQLRIVDASTGMSYAFRDLRGLLSYDENTSIHLYLFRLDQFRGQNGLPLDFTVAEGDSIFFELRLRVAENLNKAKPSDPRPPILAMEVFTLMDLPTHSIALDFVCDCQAQFIEISGFEYQFNPGIYGLTPCQPTDYDGGSFLDFKLGQGNFFPYEVRPLVRFTDFKLGFSNRIDIREARLSALSLQGATNLYENLALPNNRRDSIFSFGIESFQSNPLLDEGFSMLLQYKFSTDCQIRGSFPLFSEIYLHCIQDFPNLDDSVRLGSTNNSLVALVPRNFEATTLQSFVTSNDQYATWNFKLINQPRRIGTPTSGATPNTWIYPQSPNGSLQQFQIINLLTGDTLAPTNGIFQLGDYPENGALEFQLLGTNASCEKEEILLRYGWNCTPVTMADQISCFEDTLRLQIQSFRGEIETQIDTTPVVVPLCDTLPYLTIEVFNANLGTLYQPYVEAYLPPGVLFVPNSSQIEHPLGSGFRDVADPENPAGNLYRWNLDQLTQTIAQNGLASVNRAPSNALKIRFRALTSCDFIAGSYPVFQAAGFQNCLLKSNTRTRAGKPIRIQGVDPPYQVSFSTRPLENLGCDAQFDFAFSFTLGGNAGLRDSIFVTLPQGVQYLGNSYLPGQNAPNHQPLLAGDGLLDVLKWPIPNSLPAGSRIEMQISLNGFRDLPCDQQFLLLQTVSTENALCVSSNDFCDILVQTGSLLLPVDIERPLFNLSDFSVEILEGPDGTTTFFSVAVKNTGADADPPVFIDLIRDVNENGLDEPSDSLLGTWELSYPIPQNNSAILQGTFPIDYALACQLLAVVRSEKNCVCEEDAVAVQLPIRRTFAQPFPVCSGDTLRLGVETIPAHTYQWNPMDHLSCTNCPEAIFQAENNNPVTAVFDYRLLDNNQQGCLVENFFQVQVQPVPAILTSSPDVCAGECITLQATPSSSITWQGPGIVNPSELTPTICPSLSAPYVATIRDPVGCAGRDTLFIRVIDPPLADAGRDTVLCRGQVFRLQGQTHGSQAVQWMPAQAVSNPGILNPLLTATEDLVLTMQVISPEGCTGKDSLTIEFFDRLDLTTSAGQIICLRSKVTLSASGASEYQWQPDSSIQILSPGLVLAFPEQSTLFQVIGTRDGVCADTATILVQVVPDVIYTYDSLSLCRGDSVFIFGNQVGSPGLYSQNFLSAAGCDSVHTIALEQVPPIEFDIFSSNPVCPDSCDGWLEMVPSQPELVFSLNGSPFVADTILENLCAGVYIVEARDSFGCIAQSDSVILLDPNPFDPQIPTDTTLVKGDTFTIQVSLPVGATIVWDSEYPLPCVECTGFDILPDESLEINYIITLANGCQTTGRIRIEVNLVCNLEQVKVPNVFTPNGDGKNDTFQPDLTDNLAEVLSLEIYNRWGEAVFKGGKNSRWDASQGTSMAPSDVYVYILNIGCGTSTRMLHGDVTLLR